MRYVTDAISVVFLVFLLLLICVLLKTFFLGRRQ